MPDTGDSVHFVGLGNMGGPMAGRLLDAGITVRGFDTSEAARDSLAARGGTVASSVTDVSDASIVILMLPSSDVVEAVLLGGGLADALTPGAIVVDMSSSAPLRTQALGHSLDERSLGFVDAPVSGGVTGAQAGTLTVMVGGRADLVGTVEPVLANFGRVRPVGGIGAGHAVKALNNLMSATHLWVTSEAILAAERFGIDPAVMLDVVNGSSGRSGSTENKWPNFILPETFDSGFALDLMLKDMRIATSLAQELGLPISLGEAAVERWAQAADALPAGADHTEIVNWLRERDQAVA